MGRTTLRVELLRCTERPEELVAMAAKLCYSAVGVEELRRGVSEQDQSAFVEKLTDMGHLSPIEHAAFTFGIEGVSRSLLAQITRHRIASFSVKSQRYVGEGSDGREGGVFNYIIPPRIAELGEDEAREFTRQMEQVQQWYDYWLDKKRIDLSPKEFEILCLLAANPGRVFTRDVLLEKIWGFDSVRETRTVDVHIRYLRQKIEPDPTEPKYIETIRGVGYRFKDN